MITVLLCHERSGSHLLAEFIGSLSSYDILDEVCNIHSVIPLTNANSFHGYQFQWMTKNKTAFFKASYLDRMSFVASYFEFLENRTKAKHILVDIKYGHLHNFDWFWNPIFNKPLLLEVIQKERWKVIHLYRENSFEAALSDELALKRQTWHSWQAHTPETFNKTYTVNTQRIVQQTQMLHQQHQWIRRWLEATDHFNLTYEALVTSMNSDRLVLRELCHFLQNQTSMVDEWVPSLKKLGRHPRETVENYKELKLSLEQNNLIHYLADG